MEEIKVTIGIEAYKRLEKFDHGLTIMHRGTTLNPEMVESYLFHRDWYSVDQIIGNPEHGIHNFGNGLMMSRDKFRIILDQVIRAARATEKIHPSFS